LSLTNFGQPLIEVEEINFANRGEMLLKHIYHGVDLDLGYASDTLRNLYALWKRPVNLSTVQEGKTVTFCFDGKEMKPI